MPSMRNEKENEKFGLTITYAVSVLCFCQLVLSFYLAVLYHAEIKFCFQLPPGAVPIFGGTHQDQLRAAIAKSQKHSASADDVSGSTSQV